MGNRFWRIVIISICIICFAAMGSAFAQKKVGGGDVKYESKSQGAVLFSHDKHMKVPDTKCNSCHTKVFKMKKEAKITEANHKESVYCGNALCHDGKKAFGQTAKADCAKCHKK